MLQLLHIENIAVIERADISFRAGFNALTGETGAGKSIVIDSLGAVLGARTSRDLIRTGAAKAFVSAEFDGVDASLPVLAALGVEILTCGTCLSHYGLTDRLQVGGVTNMYVITEKQMQADLVLRP